MNEKVLVTNGADPSYLHSTGNLVESYMRIEDVLDLVNKFKSVMSYFLFLSKNTANLVSYKNKIKN